MREDPVPGLIERLSYDGDLHGPHLIDTELSNGLRRLSTNHQISSERAEDTRSNFAELALVRYSHQPQRPSLGATPQHHRL